MTRLLVATYLSGGNAVPCIAVARLLAERGHGVTVLGTGRSLSAAQRSGLASVRYPASFDVDEAVPFEDQAGDLLPRLSGLDLAQEVGSVLDRFDGRLLIADCMAPAALSAAEARGIPAIALVHFLYGAPRQHMVRRGKPWAFDLSELNRTRRHLGLQPHRDPVAAWESTSLVLVTAPRWFDLPAWFPTHVHHAGPIGVRADPAPHGPDRQNPPRVLVSFSTTAIDRQDGVVTAAALGARAAGAKVMVSSTNGSPSLPAILDDLRLSMHADHDDLLPACHAVVTHAGLGTVLRALRHGVPVVAVPLARDQAINADRVVAFGCGLRLPPDARPEAVAAALGEVFSDTTYAASCREVATRMAAARSDASAVAAIESVIR